MNAAGGTQHEQVEIEPGLCVDKGIAPLLRLLWRAGIRTRFSCQGESSLASRVPAYIFFETAGDMEVFAEITRPWEGDVQWRSGWCWNADPGPYGMAHIVRFPADMLLPVTVHVRNVLGVPGLKPGSRVRLPNNQEATVVKGDPGATMITVRFDGSYGAHAVFPRSVLREASDGI